jgi:hypothetical protein
MWMLLKTKRRLIKRVGKSVSEGEWLKGWKTKGKKNTSFSVGFTFTNGEAIYSYLSHFFIN